MCGFQVDMEEKNENDYGDAASVNYLKYEYL